MIELLKLLLSLSLSGTLLILALFLCKPLYEHRFSRQWQYYIWLVAAARLLLPFTPQISLVGNLFQDAGYFVRQIKTSKQTEADSSMLPNKDLENYEELTGNNTYKTAGESADPDRLLEGAVLKTEEQHVWLILVLIWLFVAAGLLIRKATIYQSFVKYTRAGQIEIPDIELWEQLGITLEETGVKRTVELYTNSLISSPMLIGFFQPCIMLPAGELSDIDYKNIILHELTHYKRRDMFYKWLVQVTICLHWFNPFVYLMGREINKACEFSCDEAVIKKLDRQARRAYGDTLLHAVNAKDGFKDSPASVTLSQNTKLLKERLDAIMSFHKKSKAIITATIVLTLIIGGGAAYAGAYALPAVNQIPASGRSPDTNTNIPSTEKASLATPPAPSKRENVKVNFSKVCVKGQGPVGVELIRSRNKKVTFELLNMDSEKNCTAKAAIVNGTMQITVNNHAPNGINVSFGPDYQNVVRVSIPDAVYTGFDIQSKEMVIQMQDFNAPVQVKSKRAGFWLIDKTISQGTYDIEVTSGPIYIEADTILKDITANGVSGPLTLRFNKLPENLYLDSTDCGPVVERPDSWPAIYKVGSGTPRIVLSNTGKAVIEIPETKISDKE